MTKEALTEWFCYVETCHANISLLLLMYFIRYIKWDVIISSSLRFCWKCQFDTDVKIENYNHHDEEQLLFFKKDFFKKKSTYQNTEQKEGCSCNFYIIAL